MSLKNYEPRGVELHLNTLLRIFFGLAAIGWIGYSFYLGFMPGFGSALIVVYTLVLAALFSFIDLIWKWLRR